MFPSIIDVMIYKNQGIFTVSPFSYLGTIIPGNCTNQAINQIDNTFHYSNLSYKKDLPISILSPSADTDPVLESPFEYESVVEEV